MGTILKIEDDSNSLEVELINNYISIQTCNETLEDYPIWTQIKLDKREGEELIEYLQKRLKEME